MKRSILNIGKSLTKNEQKQVHGGTNYFHKLYRDRCNSDDECQPSGSYAGDFYQCQHGFCVDTRDPHIVF